MNKEKIALLVMAYGTPYKEEDIEPYYTHIRQGRKPSPEALEDLIARYRSIGGISPLAKITEKQAHAICNQLNASQSEYEFELYIGLRHINPFIEDAVREMAEKGVTKAVSLVLAPHYSTYSVKSYNDRAKEEADKYGIQLKSVVDWYGEPKFIQYWAEQISEVYKEMSNEEREKAMLIFSAHSLPKRILADDDPYPLQLAETARMISERAGIESFEIGWQSEGNTPVPWLGPDVQDLTRTLHEAKSYSAFVYAPVGFVSDHLEILYDNDHECKAVCDEVGAAYYRPKMPNTDPLFIGALADVILKKLTLKETSKFEVW